MITLRKSKVQARPLRAFLKELFHEIGNLFIDTLPEYLNDIKSGIEKGDAHAVKRAPHRLKGSVGNFGARQSHEAALKLEKLGERGDLEAMPEAIDAAGRRAGSFGSMK